MANWGANHGVTVYGHVGADLITLASMLRIPVTMHNVPAEKVYRPTHGPASARRISRLRIMLRASSTDRCIGKLPVVNILPERF